MRSSRPIHVAVNAHGLRTSQPLWLAMSIGKHLVGQAWRVSDIHARLIGAGVIGGALSPVMNPIRGRVCLSDWSLIGSAIRWFPLVALSQVHIETARPQCAHP